MHAYFIKCNDIIYNEDGSIKEIYCTYDPETKSGSGFDKRKPNGTIHFVDASSAVPATFNHLDFLILDQYVSSENFMERINPNSWTVYQGFVEKALATAKPGEKFQFIRTVITIPMTTQRKQS